MTIKIGNKINENNYWKDTMMKIKGELKIKVINENKWTKRKKIFFYLSSQLNWLWLNKICRHKHTDK
jgi:hypothetical protein